MGDQQQTLWQEITQGIGKFFIYIIYVSIGVVVKISLDSKTGKLPFKKALVTIVLSISAGALASIACSNMNAEKLGAIIVPVSTLIAESLFGYIVANWKKWADGLYGKFFNGKK